SLYCFTPHQTPAFSPLPLHDALPICATEPGADCSVSDQTVWIESITATRGRAASSVARMRSSCVSASRRSAFIGSERRRARSARSEEHTSELQLLTNIVCRLLLEKKN